MMKLPALQSIIFSLLMFSFGCNSDSESDSSGLNATTSSVSDAQPLNTNAVIEVMCRGEVAKGSGAIVSRRDFGQNKDYLALTNQHVIKNCDGEVDVIIFSGQRLPAQIEKKHSGGLDAVLLSFSSNVNISPFLLLKMDPQTALTKPIVSLGYPQYTDRGIIRTAEQKELVQRPGTITQYYKSPKFGSSYGSTAKTETGLSGGPVLYRGALIAINQATGPELRDASFLPEGEVEAYAGAKTIGLNLLTLASDFNLVLVDSLGAKINVEEPGRPDIKPSSKNLPNGQTKNSEEAERDNSTYEDYGDGLRDL